MLSHKQQAIREVSDLNLNSKKELEHHILYYGAEQANVFIGAYATWIGRQNKFLKFDDFLREAAPYRTKQQLIAYLNDKYGIRAYSMGRDQLRKDSMFNSLRDAYGEDNSWFSTKPDILIRNESDQLLQLVLDGENGEKPIFVSGDLQLQRLATGKMLGGPGNSMISSKGFVQMIDLIIGFDVDSASMVRLIWGRTLSDDQTVIFNYLTDVALKEYHIALKKPMLDVLTDLSKEAVKKAREERVPLYATGSSEDKARQAKFLDRFEEKFYEYMAQAAETEES